MAISPPSDLVLDVVKAADPSKMQQATTRLASLSSGTQVAANGFADTLSETSSRVGDGFFKRLTATPTTTQLRSVVADAKTESPAEKFEAMVLQQFVETMLPDDAEEVFGEGSTGEIWKSMLAEQVGNKIAASGGVGIADLITNSLKESTDV